MQHEEDLLTYRDVERQYKLSREQVYRLMLSGALPFLRIGRAVRFEPAAVQTFLDSCRRPLPPLNDDGPLAGEPLVRTTAGNGRRDEKPT